MDAISHAQALREVLLELAPSRLRRYARCYMMLELYDRRRELRDEVNREDNAQGEFLLALEREILRFELRGLIVLLAFLAFLNWLFYRLGLVRDITRKKIIQIEQGLDEAAASRHASNRPKPKSQDEEHADQMLKRFQERIEYLRARHRDKRDILYYIEEIASGALDIGQSWAEGEVEYRRALGRLARAEAAYRSGFLIRAFGFGTVGLVRKLLAVLALGMAVPWLVELFREQQSDFSVLKNLIIGVGWVLLLWGITLTFTLVLNDRRMANIHTRAERGVHEAEKLKAQQLANTWTNVREQLIDNLRAFQISEDDVLYPMIQDWLASIEDEVKHLSDVVSEKDNLLNGPPKTLKEKIASWFDLAFQGDAP